MKTFTESLADFKTITNDTSTGNDTLGKTLLNIGSKKFLAMSNWSFNKDSKTYSTGTSVQYLDPPYDAAKIENVFAWYGGRWYTPRQVKSEARWTRINATEITSSIPQFWYVSNRTGQIGLFPISADSEGTVKVGFTKKIRDFSVSDYSTGSISASAGGTIFTITVGTWNTKMAGRYIQVGSTSTIIDDFWFRITDASAGTIVVEPSIPVAVTTSSGTYRISEMIPFPDGFEDLPLYFSLERYYQTKEQPTLAREWKANADELLNSLFSRDRKTGDGIIEPESDIMGYDPNRSPWGIEIET